MSNLKISPNLFIGSKELQRFKQFVDDDGFRKYILSNAVSYGIVDNSLNGSWTNFLVEQGTNVGTIKHGAGLGINNVGNFLVKAATDNITITDDSLWYWVKVAHQYVNYETYDVEVDASGNLVATNADGNFTDILRGQPNIASRVKFSGASLNTGEYDVQSVTDDDNAILQGDFQVETGLKLIVVGTFTPDANPSAGDKDIFNYDSTLLTLVQSASMPAYTAGLEFFIARVKRTGTQLVIEDKRREFVFRTKADYNSQNVDKTANPLLGVESVKYTDDFSTRQNNIVDVGWGMRSSNWTIDSNTNKVTINGGLGGKFKTTTDFTNQDFDGWRIYTVNGNYSIIKASSLSGSQINLTLNTLNESDYTDTPTQEVVIVPNADFIKIIALSDLSANDLVKVEKVFPINQGVGRFELLVYADPTASYLFKYAYKMGKDYGQLFDMPSDTASGYLKESSFDANGQPIASNRQTYTSSATAGYITLTLNASAFKNVIARVDLGDSPGVEYRTLDNASPLRQIVVGTNKQLQVFTGSLTLSVDHYLSLETTGAKEGNIFYLKFENITTLSGQSLQIVQDYVNPGNPGTLILDFGSPTDFWRDRAEDGNMFVFCEFDGTDWVVYPDSSVTQSIIDNIIAGALLADGSVQATGMLLYDADVTGKSGWPNNRGIPDKQFVDDSIAAVVAGAPATLDTLNELAAAIADDPSFSSKVILRDGTQAATADIPMGTNKITGLAAGTVAADAVNYTQLGTKQDTITGAATTIVTSNLTANRALISDGAGKVAADANVTSTELGYLDGVTSAIQTQLNGKQATVTGAATTIVSADLTINRALLSDGSGKVAVSAVTSTELGYVSGVTSAIQTQLGNKLASNGADTASGLITFSGGARFEDNDQVEFGTLAGGDWQMIHDGVNMRIDRLDGIYGSGTQDLLIQTDGTTRFTFDMDISKATAIDWIATSDERLKTDWQNNPYGLTEILRAGLLDGMFIWKENGKLDIGYSAQKIKEFMPLLVEYDEKRDVYGLSYAKFIVPLCKAILELSNELEWVKTELNK